MQIIVRTVLGLLFTFLAFTSLGQTPKAAEQITIVAIGDSLTQGDSAPSVQGHKNNIQGGWVARLQMLLDEGFPEQYQVINKGKNGDVAKGVLNRLDRDVIALEPDIVFVHIGTNDAYGLTAVGQPSKTTEEYKSAMEAIIVSLRQGPSEVKVILVGFPTPVKEYVNQTWFSWIFSGYTQEDLEVIYPTYNEVLREIAEEDSELSLIDVHAQWPKDLQGRWELSADGLHHNDEGYDLIANYAYLAVLDHR